MSTERNVKVGGRHCHSNIVTLSLMVGWSTRKIKYKLTFDPSRERRDDGIAHAHVIRSFCLFRIYILAFSPFPFLSFLLISHQNSHPWQREQRCHRRLACPSDYVRWWSAELSEHMNKIFTVCITR